MIRTLFLILFLLFTQQGCFLNRVAPYEKEALAAQKMLATPMSEEAAFEGHVFGIREGTSGAESSFQGGCGCK